MSEFTKLLNSVKNESEVGSEKNNKNEDSVIVTKAEPVRDIPNAVPLLQPINDLDVTQEGTTISVSHVAEKSPRIGNF